MATKDDLLTDLLSILMGDGSRKPFADMRVGDAVITHRGRARRVTAIVDRGALPCGKITTDCGRSVIVALDHPFLTPDGWVQADRLTPGMSLANVPTPEITPAQPQRPVEEFRLAGYFIGNGSTVYNGATITSADEEYIADYLHCAHVLGFIAEVKGYNTKSGVPVRAKRISFRGGVRPWLREIGLAGKSSYTKRVPDFVFHGDNEHVSHFVSGYFQCDGSVGKKGNVRTDLAIEIASVSRELLEDTQHLCLRLGIQARVVTRLQKYKGEPYTSYRLTLTTQHEIAKFSQRVPVFGPKRVRLDAWPTYKRRFNAVLSVDPIVAIEDAGYQPCIDITVDEDHTYTANDLVCRDGA